MPFTGHAWLKKSRSDPCLDVIKVRIQDVLSPILAPAGTRPALALDAANKTLLTVKKTTTAAQTDLSARRLKNIADGRHVNSLAFAKFITGKRVSAYDGYDEQEGAQDYVAVPRGSPADNLSVTLSERFIVLDKGPVPVMQNPRQTKVVGHQQKVMLENGEIVLQEVRASEDPTVSATVETTAASSLAASPDELPDIMHEVLKYQREMGLSRTPDGKLSKGEILQGLSGKLPQDQHSTIGELTLDGETPMEEPSAIRDRKIHLQSLGRESAVSTASRLGSMRSPQQIASGVVYDQYLTERVEENKLYLDHEHLRSISPGPEENLGDLPEDFFVSIVNGICQKCNKNLKHLELTDLFRYKLQHKDEPFKFDPENFCCEEFQRELEKLLFSRGVDRVVRDIRKSLIGSLSQDKPKGHHKGHSRGHKLRKHSAGHGELDAITRLLEHEEESSSSSSSSESEEEFDADGNVISGKRDSSNLRDKFKDRMRSGPGSKGRTKSVSDGRTRSIVGSTGGGRGTKGGSGQGGDSRVGLSGSLGSGSGQKYRSTLDQLPRLSGEEHRRTSFTGRRSTPDELDTRYRGNSITWSLSSRVCLKTGWTLRRPTIEETAEEDLYLSEKLLDVDMVDEIGDGVVGSQQELSLHQPSKSVDPLHHIHLHHHPLRPPKDHHRWPLFPACFVHWPDDPLVAPYVEPPSPTNFYPYLDGGTACVTAEYAPGFSIVVILPKSTRMGSNGRPVCPVAAIWDTASWGAVINPNWTPGVIMSPKNVIIASENGAPEQTVTWKTLKDNKANHAYKTTHHFNDETELDMQGRHEIAFTLKHEAMRMELNCGFRHPKPVYVSPSEHGANHFLDTLKKRNEILEKHIATLSGLLDDAEKCHDYVPAGDVHHSRKKKHPLFLSRRRRMPREVSAH